MDTDMDTDIHIHTMKIMIDIHNHIIYGVDDGSKNIEESKKLLMMYKKQGISKIFLTPHVNSSVSFETREVHQKRFLELKEISKQLGIEAFLGAEIYIPFRLPELNFDKINQVMMVAIEASSNFDDPIFESKLKALSQTDENLKIRNAAIKILEKTYDQVI